MIELRGIKKYFPSNGVMALQNASLTLRPGEIHALLGENGTGKSTLMHILSGYFPPTSGTILVDGKELHFPNTAAAIGHGIGMVRQHPGYIRGFKAWEDCVLGAETRGMGRSCVQEQAQGLGKRFLSGCGKLYLDPAAARKRVQELSAQWGFDLPLDKKAETLTVSQRQKAAVLALLLHEVKWFIFDEPTAVLSLGETESLFSLFGRLREEGKGIIFITHKLGEALEVSDRITVIRRGVTEEGRLAKDCSAETLEKAIFGEGIFGNAIFGKDASCAMAENQLGAIGVKTILEIRGLRLDQPGLPSIRDINLALRPGKILGIYGIRDSGLETLERAIAGFLPGEGAIALNGHDIAGKGVRAFREAGGAYLGADRLGSSLAPNLPLKESLIIHVFRRARRGLGIFLDEGLLYAWCRDIMKRAGIEEASMGNAEMAKTATGRDVFDKASSFSGGMLQRILLAREFAEDASLLVLAEPGSGLDLYHRGKLAEELKAFVRRGRAVLLFSTDMDELRSIADEIMALRNGALIMVGENGQH